MVTIKGNIWEECLWLWSVCTQLTGHKGSSQRTSKIGHQIRWRPALAASGQVRPRLARQGNDLQAPNPALLKRIESRLPEVDGSCNLMLAHSARLQSRPSNEVSSKTKRSAESGLCCLRANALASCGTEMQERQTQLDCRQDGPQYDSA